jgi:glycosyltransferase involved in cell wall biosynthesis
MRIAIVLNTSWNIYNFRMGLIRTLREAGHEVICIAPEDPYTQYLIEDGFHFENVTMDSRGANPVKDMGLTLELYRIYARVKPDLVLHFTIKPNIYGTFAAKMLGIPVINNVCGLGTIFLNDNLVSKVAIEMYRMAFKYPEKIFFQNEEDLNLFLKKGLVQPEITELLPGSGINLDHFKAYQKPEAKEPFTFLLISRLILDKGVLEFIQAVKMLRAEGLNCKFQIMGSKDPLHRRGIAVDIIDSWIEDGLIEYLGVQKDVRPYMNQADCIVLPSYREGASRTLLEAAALKKPIIATDVAGCNNIVLDGLNGYLCKLKDAEDLAAKMQKMYHTPEKIRLEMGEKGRERIEQLFDENLVVNKYLNEVSRINPLNRTFLSKAS